MPSKAAIACKRSGCPGLVRNGVCSVCGRMAQRVRALRYDSQRGTPAQRGYDGRWQRRRVLFLRAHPLCAECQRHGLVTAATDVHHVIALRNGGGDEDENLEALCHPCHSRITGRGG